VNVSSRSNATRAIAPAQPFPAWLFTLAAGAGAIALPVVASTVDVTGFLLLGNIFTDHLTGNVVIAGAVVFALVTAWLIVRVARYRGSELAELLLQLQFALLAGVMIISVIMKPSSTPHELIAGILAMVAASAIACQYALMKTMD
jgi:uncharacterized membrane protein YoaK (UPF0700 family)